jgi:hypothetical protein
MNFKSKDTNDKNNIKILIITKINVTGHCETFFFSPDVYEKMSLCIGIIRFHQCVYKYNKRNYFHHSNKTK